MSDEDTVLVLHDAELDPSPFLKRALQLGSNHRPATHRNA